MPVIAAQTDTQTPSASTQNQSRRWRMLRRAAWASLVANITIIATGGAVRLTGSGLGCPTWPTCTPGSLVPTAELSWHSAIEFGNRMMTGVLGIIAIAVLVLLWRWRSSRKDLFILANTVLFGIIAQAIVGGITVWTGLNPAIVGFHYLASATLVSVCAAFVYKMDRPYAVRELQVPVSFAMLTHLLSVVLLITLVVGVLTTASGPHSGDKEVLRNGVDAALLAHFHAWPGYLLLTLTLLAVTWAYQAKLPASMPLLGLLLVEGVQIAVGVYQARSGLPPLAVGVHMVLAAVSTAIMVIVLLQNKLEQPDKPLAPVAD